MANLTGLIRLHLGTYINLYAFLANPDKALLNYIDPLPHRQLFMFPKHTEGSLMIEKK